MGELSRALAAWRAIVGDEHVRIDPQARREAARATFATAAAPSCIVRPGGLAELQACVRAASEWKVPIYPTSRGRNLGYGSRVPIRDGAALLDLGRMDRIDDLDLELGTAAIEPGVTFAALAARLGGTGYTIARTGAPADASVLANSLERGIGRGRHGSRADRLCGLHVVLPGGALLRTGFDRHPDARCRGLSRFGVGPALDGMFFQSRLGVVARATLWLTPRPAWSHELQFTLDRRERLAAVVDALRPLKLADAAPHTISIYNDRRLLTIAGGHAGDWPEGQALPQAVVDRRNPAGEGARWLGRLEVDGPSAAIGAATLEHVMTCLQDHVDRLASRPSRRRDPPALGSDDALARLYWRVGEAPALPDPLADGCGLLWCAPAVPARGDEVVATIAWLEDLVAARGFDPAITLQWSEPRVIHLVLALLFDRRRPGADARALACHDEVVRGLAARGLVPYRLGLPAMHLAGGTDPAHAAAFAAIRRALDPADILAPGRYEAGDPDAGRDDGGQPGPVPDRRRWQFGRAELAPAELELRLGMGEALFALARELPGPLRAAATAFLDVEARGRGPEGLLRKFPAPLWVCLSIEECERLPAALLAAARAAQPIALLLHLLDDHLCDGQLRCDHALLQLRTRAWSRFEAAIARLAAGLPGADAFAGAQIERYFAAVERPRGPTALADALDRARGEMATWPIVPALCVWRTAGAAARDAMVAVLERLFVAWRIVDDLDDIDDDARQGAASVVPCVLSPAGRAAWSHQNDDCIGIDASRRDIARLRERVEIEGVAPALARRAHAELARAAADASAAGWPRLAAHLLALARPLAVD